MSETKDTQQFQTALHQLDAFAGTWKTEGTILATAKDPAVSIMGTDTYEWLPGGYCMIHYVDVRMGDTQIDSVEIIGYDPSTGKYPMHYFGYQGSTGVMYASVSGNTWTFTGETERFTGSFNKAGNIISGKWERLDDNKWVHWMDIQLTRID